MRQPALPRPGSDPDPERPHQQTRQTQEEREGARRQQGKIPGRSGGRELQGTKADGGGGGGGGEGPFAPLRLEGMSVAGVWHGMVDAPLLSRLRRAGQLAVAWTVEAAADLDRLLDLGAGENPGGDGLGPERISLGHRVSRA
jgi:hypothetical protein